MKKQNLVIATRQSALALWQAHMIQDLIKSLPAFANFTPELLPMVSTGDIKLDTVLAKVGGKGLFTYELEQALKAQQAQIAVHSLKDVPMIPEEQFFYTYNARHYHEDLAVFPQGSPYQRLADLPAGSVVGTASVRRKALLAHFYPHLQTKLLRGNVNTRLAKLNDPEQGYDAIILARAGLARLEFLEQLQVEILSPQNGWVSAPGQGIVAVQWDKNQKVAAYSEFLNDPVNQLLTDIERGVARHLGGSCSLPLGVYAGFVNSQGQEVATNIISSQRNAFALEVQKQVCSSADLEQTEQLLQAYQQQLKSLPALQEFAQSLDLAQIQVQVFVGDLQAQKTISRSYSLPFGKHSIVDLQTPELQAQVDSFVATIVQDLQDQGFKEIKTLLDQQLAEQ
ncbi:hydroxymethylbilane synthase [Psittacicella gerlachiana]|nr:hydroxymethylbilane synthase [Psittacicella gerlachiana]